MDSKNHTSDRARAYPTGDAQGSTRLLWEMDKGCRTRTGGCHVRSELEVSGTMDAIFALRQLYEKYRRAYKNLHMVFIDLERAYDRVPREVLWWALKEKGLPGKYVELVRAMYRGSCTYVRLSAGNTEQFSVAVGLHQGSALSPYLFLLIMDALKANIQEEAPWCMLFANDIVLIGEDGLEIQSRLEDWQQKLENVGLKISRTKTEYMFCDFGGLSGLEAIALDGVALPVCSDFRYLGSLIQDDGKIDRTVKHRINTGWMKWRQVTGTICEPRIPLKLKGKIYKTMRWGRLKKRWMDCVKDDMSRKNVTCEMTSDREVWKKKTCCADPK
ncbi:uncharacterized protein LOC135193915 [Vanessa tameamea]|uniref:Uncharacterized protein LOC135193915 n=1 Tax=Vanessa tameamea TaxID=334116 RepID=A0ABM4AT21_VANTA